MDPEVSFPEGWSAPQELMGPLPRKTRIGRGGVQTVVLGTAVLLFGGGCFLSYFSDGVGELARTAALRRGSREATGVVTRLWSKSRTHMVRYAFTANGVAVTGECSVPIDHWADVREAGPLSIRFLPSSPAMNHPVAWQGPVADWWVPCVFMALIAGVGIWVLVQLRWDRRLAAEGVPAAGVILSCSQGGRGGWAAKYQFRTEHGRVTEGRGASGDALEIGSAVCVVYLRDDCRRNQMYATLLYRVAE